jgi:hypothetical protein
MESRSFRRRTVALIAAYAVALQALLSAFVAVGPAIDISPIAALCAHDGTDGTGHRSGHDLPCAAICAALGHAIAGPLPPAIVVAYAGPATAALPQPLREWQVPPVRLDGPQAPRGPPLA